MNYVNYLMDNLHIGNQYYTLYIGIMLQCSGSSENYCHLCLLSLLVLSDLSQLVIVVPSSCTQVLISQYVLRQEILKMVSLSVHVPVYRDSGSEGCLFICNISVFLFEFCTWI
jgi:hypothetical protein